MIFDLLYMYSLNPTFLKSNILHIYHYYNAIIGITNDFLIQKGLNNVSCYLDLFIAQFVLMYVYCMYLCVVYGPQIIHIKALIKALFPFIFLWINYALLC